MISVDIAHHVYMTDFAWDSVPTDKPYGFCGRRAPCLLILLVTPSLISLMVSVDIKHHVY